MNYKHNSCLKILNFKIATAELILDLKLREARGYFIGSESLYLYDLVSRPGAGNDLNIPA
jgi:hypothetical protein